jgi:uncharacterized protein (DUF849 family)
MEHDSVIIEVGLNEGISRDVHPAIPISPAEIAADALRCEAAGAAVVHWHARDPADGSQRAADARLYGEALELMRAGGTVLGYPTYPTQPPDSLDERLGHCFTLRRDHGLELAPIDIGSVNVITWNDAEHEFVGAGGTLAGRTVVQNSLGFTLSALERFGEVGLVPSVASFDIGFTRTMVNLVRAGKLPEPVFFKIFMMGAWAVGPNPDAAALEFHLHQIPDDLDIEWVVVPYTMADPLLVERLCRRALDLGGGIRVGIGDNPSAHPGLTNAELVTQAAAWARDSGRPIAGAADVRARFALDGRDPR